MTNNNGDGDGDGDGDDDGDGDAGGDGDGAGCLTLGCTPWNSRVAFKCARRRGWAVAGSKGRRTQPVCGGTLCRSRRCSSCKLESIIRSDNAATPMFLLSAHQLAEQAGFFHGRGNRRCHCTCAGRSTPKTLCKLTRLFVCAMEEHFDDGLLGEKIFALLRADLLRCAVNVDELR